MKGKIQQHITGLLLGGLLISTAGAEVYKWTDEQGRVHYGDKPPDQGARQMQIDAGNGSPGPIPSEAERREKTQRLLRAYDEERRIKQQQEQRQEAEEAERRRRCARARDRLRRYTYAGSLYQLDDQGNRRYLDDSNRQQTEERARQEVEKWCS
ncbi:MAG: DUF4124 domain-containing protein [Thiohalophilus sp.]|jgi:hypothetical protein